jgi:hypothetical protein
MDEMLVNIVENVGPQCRLKTDEQAAVLGHSILTRIHWHSHLMSRPGVASGKTLLLLTVRLLLEGKAPKCGAMVHVDCIVEAEHTAHKVHVAILESPAMIGARKVPRSLACPNQGVGNRSGPKLRFRKKIEPGAKSGAPGEPALKTFGVGFWG